jgi:tetratricopeptide (TPR) repeat protein
VSIADIERQLLAAKLDLAAGAYRQALGGLDRMAALTAEDEAHRLILAGQGHEGLNDVGRASAAYDRAHALAPGLHLPILRQGVLRYRRGDPEAARRLLSRYVQLEPGNPEAFFYLALCEPDQSRRSAFVRRLAILDGPAGTWSRELLRSFRSDA